MVSVNTFPSTVVAKDWGICQLDVQNLFLNEDLEEEEYTRFPPIFFYWFSWICMQTTSFSLWLRTLSLVSGFTNPKLIICCSPILKITISLLFLCMLMISFWLAITLVLVIRLRISYSLGSKSKILTNINTFWVLNLFVDISERFLLGCKPATFPCIKIIN